MGTLLLKVVVTGWKPVGLLVLMVGNAIANPIMTGFSHSYF